MERASYRIRLVLATVIGVSILQSVLLWQLGREHFFVCNENMSWPFFFAFKGSFIIPLVITVGLAVWVWRGKLNHLSIFFWSLILATGISHTLERLMGGCVLDYWTIPLMGRNLHFNGGDIFLTIGCFGLIAYWFWKQKINS